LCAQIGPIEYAYSPWVHDVGKYMLLVAGVVWAWMNVALSFITRPLLSSLLATWLRVIFAFAITVTLIVAAFLPVFFEIFP